MKLYTQLQSEQMNNQVSYTHNSSTDSPPLLAFSIPFLVVLPLESIQESKVVARSH